MSNPDNSDKQVYNKSIQKENRTRLLEEADMEEEEEETGGEFT